MGFGAAPGEGKCAGASRLQAHCSRWREGKVASEGADIRTQVWANKLVKSLDECEGIHPETGRVRLALLLSSLGIFAKYSPQDQK